MGFFRFASRDRLAQMDADHIIAEILLRHIPHASCSECDAKPEAPSLLLWTVLKGKIYCPKCAKYQNIGPDFRK